MACRTTLPRGRVPSLSLCTGMSRIPAEERKAAASVSCLSPCSAKGGGVHHSQPPPRLRQPILAVHAPSCEGCLALFPGSLCWDLAAALSSPARAKGPIGLPIKSSFFCLQADTGVCLGQDQHSDRLSGLCWP